MVDAGNIILSFDNGQEKIKDIERCLRTLYSTKEGTVPLDREFGINWDFVGEPLPVAQNKFALEVVKKTAKYEKRVKVKEVTYQYNAEAGMMIPTVHLTGGEET